MPERESSLKAKPWVVGGGLLLAATYLGWFWYIVAANTRAAFIQVASAALGAG